MKLWKKKEQGNDALHVLKTCVWGHKRIHSTHFHIFLAYAQEEWLVNCHWKVVFKKFYYLLHDVKFYFAAMNA
jgi:hypothetical protein